MTRLRYWWPAVAWAALIFFFSTRYFSGDNTSLLLAPLLEWLLPNASAETLALLHAVVRKAGHIIGYVVLSVLLLRGARGERSGWQMRWALAAWLIATGYAASDEIHQTFEPGRGGAVNDVVLDSVAAGMGQMVVFLKERRKG